MLGAQLTADKPVFALEGFADMWLDGEAMCCEHFTEVDEEVEPRRAFRMNVEVMTQCEALGAVKTYTARVAGQLAAYVTWQLADDVESMGLLVAHQGAWFSHPRFARQHIGTELYKFSLAELRKLGVQLVFPHHRLQGRGARLGSFFARLGAKHIQQTYSLWIGD